MRSFLVGRTSAESWLRTAIWYQALRRFMRVAAIETGPMVEATDNLRDALELNLAAIVDLYSKGPGARHRAVAERLVAAWDEIQEAAGENYPESLGVLPEIMQVVKYGVPAVMSWCWKWGGRALIAAAVIGVGPPLIKGIARLAEAVRDIAETDAERARRATEEIREAAREKQRLIEQCRLENAGNPAAIAACIESTTTTFDALMPSGDCGLLDTPTGTALGGIMGLIGGYVVAESVFGWVE